MNSLINKRLAVVFITTLILLMACEPEPGTSADPSSGGIVVPRSIREADLPQFGTLLLIISINTYQAYFKPVEAGTDTINASIPVSSGNNQLEIKFVYGTGEFGDVPLATLNRVIEMKEGTNTLTINSEDYLYPDTDKDGLTNLKELELGSNPNKATPLDLTFGDNGIVSGGGNGIKHVALTIDENQKIITAGIDSDKWIVWRYLTDGTPDTLFNSVGSLTQASTIAAADRARLATDSDAKIFLQHIVSYPFGINDVWPIDSNGVPETSLSLCACESLIIDKTDRFLFTGTTAQTNGDMAVWRYLNNGNVDPSLNDLSLLTYDRKEKQDAGQAIAIDGKNRIVVAGFTLDAGDQRNLTIWRFDNEGNPEIPPNEFGTNGVVIDDVFNSGEFSTVSDMVIDQDNKILVATTINGDIAVWRFNEDGSPDDTFNNSGYVVFGSVETGLEYVIDRAYALALDQDGKIIVTGESSNVMLLLRFNIDGTLDESFNGTGVYKAYFGANGNDVAVDANNRIVVSGTAYSKQTFTNGAMIWRFKAPAAL